MSPRARRMTAREVEDLLRRHGFQPVSQKDGHRKWRQGRSGLQVVVPQHRGRQLPIGTLRPPVACSTAGNRADGLISFCFCRR